MATIDGEYSFYVLRFLLGMAEGGFIPAVNFYMVSWIPPSFRSRINAILIMGIPLASIFGGPLAGALMHIEFGMSGWRWLFLLGGLPTVFVGLIVLRCLPATPGDATFLNERQCLALLAVMHRETIGDTRIEGLWTAGFRVFRQPILWGLLLVLLAAYTIAYYGPLNASIQNYIGANAGPLALVTTIGSLGGFFGSTLTGFVMQASDGQWQLATQIFAGMTLLSAVLAVICVRNQRQASVKS